MTGPVTCLACGAACPIRYRWQGFSIHGCPSCGLETAEPKPEAETLESFYQGFNAEAMDRWQERLARVRPAVAHYVERYRRHGDGTAPRTFLDLGGGAGYWARACQDLGIRACLVDYGEDALRFARDTLGVTWTIQGDVAGCDAALPADTFDLVLARHAVEHVRDPDRFLDGIATVSGASAMLQIETPNVASREQLAHPAIVAINLGILRRSNPDLGAAGALAHALRKSMSGINPPKHLWGFTAEALRRLLERHGFAALEMHREPAGHRLYDPLYWDIHRLAVRRLPGIPYYAFERLASLAFRGRGMNLAVLARRTGTADGRR